MFAFAFLLFVLQKLAPFIIAGVLIYLVIKWWRKRQTESPQAAPQQVQTPEAPAAPKKAEPRSYYRVSVRHGEKLEVIGAKQISKSEFSEGFVKASEDGQTAHEYGIAGDGTTEGEGITWHYVANLAAAPMYLSNAIAAIL